MAYSVCGNAKPEGITFLLKILEHVIAWGSRGEEDDGELRIDFCEFHRFFHGVCVDRCDIDFGFLKCFSDAGAAVLEYFDVAWYKEDDIFDRGACDPLCKVCEVVAAVQTSEDYGCDAGPDGVERGDR